MNFKDNDKRLFVLSSAYLEIIKECLHWKDVETGTLLVGAQIPEGYLVTKALSPGQASKRSAGSFSPDIGYLQRELEAYRLQHPGEDFLGIHHQHPGHLIQPSYGDRQQAREILTDSSYKINGKLLSIITVRQNDGIHIHPYQITVDSLEFHPMGIEILDDGDSRISHYLSQSLFLKSTPAPAKPTGSFWEDPGFQWYLTTFGQKRLEEDIQGISKETGIKANVIKTQSGTLILKLNRLVIHFPREYPLNPPRVFVQNRKGLHELKDKRLLSSWNTTSSIGEIILKRPYRNHLLGHPLHRWLIRPL